MFEKEQCSKYKCGTLLSKTGLTKQVIAINGIGTILLDLVHVCELFVSYCGICWLPVPVERS